MPFLATIPGALLASTAVTAGAGLAAANKASKSGAGSAGQVDIDALDAKTRDIAKRNALESAELERQLTPEVPTLRTEANKAVLRGISNDTENEYAGLLKARLGLPIAGDVQSPLLAAAIEKAKADLALGGALPQDVQNAITRSSLAKAADVGGGGLGLGRDLVARDLGLTSLQLGNQRLQNAATLGAQEADLGKFNVETKFNNAADLINNVQLLRAINGDSFGRALGAANYGQSIGQPVVGLDPGSVADAVVGNANNAQAAAANKAMIKAQTANNMIGTAGNLASTALLAYGMRGGMACWVAREVYGTTSPRWTQFRSWLLNDAPASLRAKYLKYGRRLAKAARTNPSLRSALRNDMDNIILQTS